MRKWNSVPPESVEILRADRDEAEPARRRIDRLRCDVGRDVEHHLVGNEPRLAARRNAGEAGLARKRPVRQPIARNSTRQPAVAKAAIPGRAVRGAEWAAEIRGATALGLILAAEVSAFGIAAASQGGLALRTAALRTALALQTAFALQATLALRAPFEWMLRLGCTVKRALHRSGGPAARERADDCARNSLPPAARRKNAPAPGRRGVRTPCRRPRCSGRRERSRPAQEALRPADSEKCLD